MEATYHVTLDPAHGPHLCRLACQRQSYGGDWEIIFEGDESVSAYEKIREVILATEGYDIRQRRHSSQPPPLPHPKAEVTSI